MVQPHIRLGVLLVEAGLISEENLRYALEEQRGTKKRLGQLLIEKGFISEEELLQRLVKQFNLEILPPDALDNIEPRPLQLVPETLARHHTILPLQCEGQTLYVATADPVNVEAVNDLQHATGLRIRLRLAPAPLIQKAIDRHYANLVAERGLERILQQDDGLTISTSLANDEGALDLLELKRQVDLPPVVKLVNDILIQAIDDRASDIHIEPYEDRVLVRNRTDGILFDAMRVPAQFHLPVVSRIKILTNMDIAERRLPQDGGFRVTIGGSEYDFRVSTLPTTNGEKVVLRILEREAVTTRYSLESLGFTVPQLAIFEAAIRRPWGMVLMTGPTGSGKSTTLHTALRVIRSPRTNIITIEDPVEYHQPGIQQVQVRPGIGLDFAQVLRSILRQDPDIIMVGEIRDGETAQMALRAALTGHLLFSTLHTNDAVSTIVRLINIGLEPHLVGAALVLAAAQRLVRKLCLSCKEPYAPTPAEQALFDFLPAPPTTLYRGAGCDACHNTGYKGRIAVYELFPITPQVRQMINDRADLAVLRQQAAEAGLDSLRRSGLRKAVEHITSVEEVLATCIAEE
jgi:type IV pilus assembly protein PilB